MAPDPWTTTHVGWRKSLAVALAIWMVARPVAAHAGDPGSAAGSPPERGVAARATGPHRPMPMTEAIRTAAERHSAELIQAPAPPRRRTAAGCVGRIALFGAIGGGAGLIAAGALLAATGGSDDTGGILSRFGLRGAVAGAAVGALLCAV